MTIPEDPAISLWPEWQDTTPLTAGRLRSILDAVPDEAVVEVAYETIGGTIVSVRRWDGADGTYLMLDLP